MSIREFDQENGSKWCGRRITFLSFALLLMGSGSFMNEFKKVLTLLNMITVLNLEL